MANSHLGRPCIRLLTIFIVIMFLLIFYDQMNNPALIGKIHPKRAQCRGVLSAMTVGNWIARQYSEDEAHKIQQFLHAVRQQLFLPYSMEREDRRCGNVTFDELEWRMHDLHWFRALCNPDGDTPCCYNNYCVAKEAKYCYCDECYDMRHPIHAELAKWVPSNANCQMTTLTDVKDVCHVLNNMTIYIIGDSLLRHVYVALLDLIRSDKYYGPLLQYTAPGLIQMCNRDFVHLQICTSHIDRDTWECKRSVKLKFFEYVRSSQSNLTLSAIMELKERPNSLVLLGIGIHDNFNLTSILNELIYPLVKIASSYKWPRIVWSSTHSPGLMKSPRIASQNNDNILHYNSKVEAALQGSGIPLFNTFQLTNGTMSFDGVHYGKGVNDVKAQILLNYILELRELNYIDDGT